MAKSKNRRQREKQRRKQAEKRRDRTTGQPAREAAAARKGAGLKVRQAQAAWNEGRHGDALRLYERALARDPTNAALLVTVAQAYGQRYDHQRASELIDRADALAPNDIAVQGLIGDLQIKLKDFAAAEQCFRHILAQSPDRKRRVRAQVALARIYERLHRTGDAIEIVEQAVRDWPDHPNANFYAAKLLRRAGDTEAAIAAFRNLTRRTDVSAEVKANAWYEIANVLDKSGEYDAAFETLLQAKEAYRGQTDSQWRVAHRIAENNELMLSTITASHFQRWADWGNDLAPLPSRLAWLIGHPRSGTTLIEQVLDSHVGLVSADELDVLSRCVYPELGAKTSVGRAAPKMLDSAERQDVNTARSDYWQKSEAGLGEAIGERILLDKNPELTLLLPMICRTFPESKVLFALRDPRDVVVSCFFQSLPLNSVSVHYLSLEDTAKKYAATMSGWLKLREWINVDWIEVRYEETVDDLEAQARRTLQFLELDWDEKVLDYRERVQTKHVHSPTYEAVTKPVYRSAIGRWRNYARQLEPVLDTLEPLVKELGYDR